jgi:prepilin-type N-terminal cleavage/methylation domain-containing protein
MRERGFTLVELLVATALLTGGVLVVTTMTLTAYERVDRSGEMRTALTIAQQRLETLRGEPDGSPLLVAGTMTETFGGEQAGFACTTQIVDDTPLEGVKQVEVVVDTPSGRSVRLDSLIGVGSTP